MGYSKVEVATYSVLQVPASAEGLVVSKCHSYVGFCLVVFFSPSFVFTAITEQGF